MAKKQIDIVGARVHNLKSVDVSIPRDKLVVITGLSGSGKSSLAFDTIYAEGQRRYMETLSSYARQFVGNMERPDVDHITGLSPVVAIEQKTTNKNPRSTVGTVTEINDFLRLLYARASRAYSPATGELMVRYSDEQICSLMIEAFSGRRVAFLAPVVKGRKGHYRELFESMSRKGYIYARIDGKICEFGAGLKLDRYKIHTIEMVIDRLVIGEEHRERMMTSLKETMRQGKGTMMLYDYATEGLRYYSRHLMCPTTGQAFEEPAPHTFSFNSPKGACPECNGLGERPVFDMRKIVPDGSMSIREGGIDPFGTHHNNALFAMLEMLGHRYDFTLDDPIDTISHEGMNAILYGDSEPLMLNLAEFASVGGVRLMQWPGLSEWMLRDVDEESKKGTCRIRRRNCRHRGTIYVNVVHDVYAAIVFRVRSRSACYPTITSAKHRVCIHRTTAYIPNKTNVVLASIASRIIYAVRHVRISFLKLQADGIRNVNCRSSFCFFHFPKRKSEPSANYTTKTYCNRQKLQQ